MVFSSIPFLLYFLPAFLLVLTLVPKTWKNVVILAFSLFFYAWGAPLFIFVLVASTIADFFIVRQLHRAQEEGRRKAFLLASLGLNLSLLAYFKYANFFIENINASLSLWGISSLSWTEVALPIGISFYTFQTLTYSIDVYRRAHAPLEKVSDYLLYIMSFPQMIAGPIVRYQEVADQIRERTSTTEDKLLGFYRFTLGLAKKVFIANVLGKQADIIFGTDPTLLDLPTAWLGAVAYAGQIYFDFAGYSDMAIGLGRMMGFCFRRISRVPTPLHQLPSFGAAGTLPSAGGCATICTSPRRESGKRQVEIIFQPMGGLLAFRFMAWCFMELRHLGSLSWLFSHSGPAVPGPSTCCHRTFPRSDHHLYPRHHRLGVLPPGDLYGSNQLFRGHVQR